MRDFLIRCLQSVFNWCRQSDNNYLLLWVVLKLKSERSFVFSRQHQKDYFVARPKPNDYQIPFVVALAAFCLNRSIMLIKMIHRPSKIVVKT